VKEARPIAGALEGLRPLSANLFRMFFVKTRHKIVILSGAQDDDLVASWRCPKNSVFSDCYCLPNKLALMGLLRPVFFGPCTLLRTRGTRPIS
jgi:hypothetical protein